MECVLDEISNMLCVLGTQLEDLFLKLFLIYITTDVISDYISTECATVH